jgi:uncharacterized membrane protein YbhN (UPF0104 family)
MKQPSPLRWALPVLRYGLCAAAIVYLYFKIPWRDHVRLIEGATVLLVGESEAGYRVRHADGREETVAADKLVRIGEGGPPAVEYGIASVARRLGGGYALAAVLLFLPVPFMAAQRLVWMLAIQEVPLTFWRSVQFTFAGNFFNFALPGTTGGDLIKAYYIAQLTHRKTEAVTTIFLDRVIGLMGLMILASVMFLFSRTAVPWDPKLYASIATGLGVVWGGLVAGSLVVFSGRLRRAFGLPALAARLPAGEQLLRVGRATVAMRQRIPLVLLCLANTVALQLLVVISAYVMSLALSMAGGFVLFFICVPIGFLIAAIPISPPQAFGVMEVAYIQFFASGGLNTSSQAFAFALAVRVIQLIWALPGVLVPLLGAHLPRKEELESMGAAEALPAAASGHAERNEVLAP